MKKPVKCPSCKKIFYTDKLKPTKYEEKPQCGNCGSRFDPQENLVKV